MTQSQKQQVFQTGLPENQAIRRILIVDDSGFQRRVLGSTLKRWGFDVVEAETGEEALTCCGENLPDLVISDWVMPGMSGIEFCEAFRALTQDDFRYFILLTSKSEKAEIAEGLEAGADDFLIKPVDTAELRARITAGERIIQMHRELAEKNRIVQVTLEELQRLYDVIDRDLQDARDLQQSLVPERHRVFPEGEISLLLRSAGHVGGDLVGFFPTDDGKLGIYAIDVSGHGISSALMTARLAGTLSNAGREMNVALQQNEQGLYVATDPKSTVETLNDLVLSEMDSEHYFTILIGFVELKTGKVVMSQAGHPHPAIQRSDGRIEFFGGGGFPVGLVQDVTFDQFEFSLSPGDRLILLSDGVTECADPNGVMLEENGLEDMLRNLQQVETKNLFEAMVWKLTDFAKTEDFGDDVSGLIFEYRGAPD